MKKYNGRGHRKKGAQCMLSQNYINDAHVAIKKFCGVDLAQPIWGELQHSLWLNSNAISNTRPRFFPTVFTWNDLFRFRNAITIGDPILYLDKVTDFQIVPRNNRFGLFPSAKLHSQKKQINEFNFRIELDHIEKLHNQASLCYPGINFEINLHPTLRESKILIDHLLDMGYAIQSKTNLEEHLALLKNYELLVSDYPGAHIFRASFFGSETRILQINHEKPNLNYESKVRKLIDSFQDINLRSRKREIAGIILGYEYLRSKKELRNLMGFTSLKKILGPSLSYIYKSSH